MQMQAHEPLQKLKKTHKNIDKYGPQNRELTNQKQSCQHEAKNQEVVLALQTPFEKLCYGDQQKWEEKKPTEREEKKRALTGNSNL